MPCQLRYIININNSIHSRDIVVNVVIDTCYTCYNRLATFLMYNMIYVILNHTNWVQITWQTEIKYIYTYIKVLSQNCLAITLTSRASVIYFFTKTALSPLSVTNVHNATMCMNTAITCAAAIWCFCQL